MAAITFTTGLLPAIQNWTIDAFGWALLGPAAAPDPASYIYMDQLLAYDPEFIDTSYARQVMTTPTITVHDSFSEQFIAYGCDPPDFGVMGDFNVASFLVLFHDTGSDTTNEVVQVYPINYTADGVNTCIITLSGGNAFIVSASCPAEF